MKKIKMIYERDNDCVQNKEIKEYNEYDKSKLVIAFKIDGTACCIHNGKFYKRYDNKKNKPAKEDWIECYHNATHWIYWVPVEPTDKYHIEAWNKMDMKVDGTYELVGPKINGNKHGLKSHQLISHQSLIVGGTTPQLTKQGWKWLMSIADELNSFKIEGFVLWDVEKMEPMFKIRKNDLIKGWW